MPATNTTLANAYPRKHFFFEMFTRDISLEDCILDLIDNSIDGLVRSRHIDISTQLLRANGNSTPSASKAVIEVSYTESQFEIKDNCGGISRDHALKEVFNFGHGPDAVGGVLSVYGIGLKRAIFKIGELFEMDSKTETEGFAVRLNVKQWAEKDDVLDDWKIPLTFIDGAGSSDTAGTLIRIKNLRPEVVMRMKDGVLAQHLRSVISHTYGLFLGRYVSIILNGVAVEGFEIPIGESDEVKPGHQLFEDGEVKVELFASLAQRKDHEWKGETAGWYVLCNGRIVLSADKTELTGWGAGALPQFHTGKFRGFVGIAFFQSNNPLELPWTTTKRGLNRESPVFQRARNEMRSIARPIITFLDSLYKGEPTEENAGRDIADTVRQVSLSTMAAKPPSNFTVQSRTRTYGSTVRIQFDADRADVERIKNHLKKFRWASGRVGKFTFEYYLQNECPE
jgi:hypothetical protein